ncbi:MAG: hypothetical protein ACOX6T_16265 [Myxococcales bacterium]|jgi:hypothetical protein
MPRPPSFADLDAALASIGPKERRRNPWRSVLEALAEARRLAAFLTPFRARFAALPDLDLAALDRLPELVDRVEQAELIWTDLKIKRGTFSLRRLRDEAVSLRYRLVAAAEFVDPEGPKPLKDGFHERRTLPRLVADLRTLADLVDERPEDFSGAKSLPERPSVVARQIADALVLGGYDSALARAQADRNAAFALLDMAVQEVRSAGRYLFRHEPDLLARLSDQSRRRPRRRSPTRERGSPQR